VKFLRCRRSDWPCCPQPPLLRLLAGAASFATLTQLADLKRKKPHIFTESQRGRVGRDLCGSPSPTPLPKQGHPEQAAQHRVQAGLEYLQRRRLHSLPGQLLPAELFELALRRGW